MMFDYINAYCRVDKFWNSEIDYKSSRARADHQLVVRAVDGTVASGEELKTSGLDGMLY